MSMEDCETSSSPFERVYRGLIRALHEGRIVPGQRLVAPDVMNQFSVGRGTVREVFNRLASRGIISIVLHRGAEVRRLTRSEIVDLLEIVELLLGLAARRAAGQTAAAESREMFLACHDLLRASHEGDDFTGFLEAREDYYRTIVTMSGNRELQQLFPTALVQIMRIQLRSYNHAADSVHLGDYDELTRAIVSTDPVRAEAAGRKHVQLTMQRVVDLPDRAFAQPGR